MPKLKRLSGKEVVGIFTRLGFQIQAQKGSHVKLRRTTSSGTKEILTVPMHAEIDAGTLRAIVRQAGQYLSEEDLLDNFFA